ncbi:MAG: FAD-dependent monooxygenase [Clostridia bacterium]
MLHRRAGARPAEVLLKAVIVGGGIGGLAAALFLRRAGLEATVYEQAEEAREVGAGIVVAPNMVRLMARLGLADALEAFAVRLEAAWEFRRWQDGRVLSVQAMGEACRQQYSAHCYVAHRADLLALLQRSLPVDAIHLGQRCISLRQDADRATAVFADRNGRETSVDADVVIGADGIHSIVREAVVPDIRARFSGLSAFRCLVPADRAPRIALRPVQTLWLGPGRHFVHYPISSGRLVNVVAFVPAGEWRTESWTADGRVEDLVSEFEGWAGPVVDLARSATETRRWAIYDRDPLERWTDGRVALLGDAAHAMLPFFAQGAAQAIEDAFVLSECLRAAPASEAAHALARYARIRQPRATRVQLMSRGREVRNHLPDGAAQEQRDAELGAGNPLRDSAWLYGHDVAADLENRNPSPITRPR